MQDEVKLAIEQKESITLEKNSKGYNWTIKICSPIQITLPSDFNRLKEIDEKLREEYGG